MTSMEESMRELFMSEAEIAEADWEKGAETWSPEDQDPVEPA